MNLPAGRFRDARVGVGLMNLPARAGPRSRPRQTGADALVPVNSHRFGSDLVIARDQIHVYTEPASGERGEVWAHDLRGRVRWRFELDLDVSVRALVPLHRRLFILTSQEELICLEETPGRDGEERSTLAE